MRQSISEALIYSTVKITAITGKEVKTGTGFFWNASPESGWDAICMVTNKHVIAGADSISIRFHLAKDETMAEPAGRFLNYKILVHHSDIVQHPDSNIDLCAFGVGNVIADISQQGETLFYRALAAKNVPSPADWSDFDAIEDVLMVGCPNGIVDEVNNRPIVRRGITATQMSQRYNGKSEFMVDMACFPGSSGSPVFVNQLGYFDRTKNAFMVDGRRFFIVGVLYAGPLINSEGIITFGNAPSIQVASMMHLGNVIQSGELLVLDQAIISHHNL